MNIALLLEMAAGSLGERVAIVAPDRSLTYAQLYQRAQTVARFVAARPGTTVAYVGLNSSAFPQALFGAALAARPFSPLNYRLPDAELRKIVARTAPSTVIVDDEMRARIEGIDGVELISITELLALPDSDEMSEVPMDADIAVLTHEPALYDAAASGHNVVGWSPYHGMTLPWRVSGTFVRGIQAFDGRDVLAEPGSGRFVRPPPTLPIET